MIKNLNNLITPLKIQERREGQIQKPDGLKGNFNQILDKAIQDGYVRVDGEIQENPTTQVDENEADI